MKIPLWLFLQLRWFWFHLSPRYKKFYIGGDETYFYDRKNNTIEYNYFIK